MNEVDDRKGAIAIIGMAGRFPGSPDVETLWRNLVEGVDCITRFSPSELRAAGIAEEMINHPRYVPAKGVLDGADQFDIAPFRMNVRQAELTDPQHRVFLECALTALEDAGHAGQAKRDVLVGVFAGSGSSQYGQTAALSDERSPDAYQRRIGSEKDFLATRVSYELDLRGPSLSVQSACSTSLVAVCLAMQSLLAYQCDIALAGGVSISLPLQAGYLHEPGMVLSKDGRCRAFDADASGTVPGDGVGVVILRRLEDAIANGDRVLAVLRGYGLRNDGAAKQSFSAPGVDGQAEAIADAFAMSGLSTASITYIEAHGTGTNLGDPIETAALAHAYRRDKRRAACALGSLKSNIGHLDAAAGIASLIKVVSMLQHRMIPKTLHVTQVNPGLELDHSPFFVNTSLRPWESPGPRRAAVSSFGIGGTNAHVIVEEAPELLSSTKTARPQLLTLSAATPQALDTMSLHLSRFLTENPQIPLSDVAFTLQTGRRLYRHRRSLLCTDHAEAIAALADRSPSERVTAAVESTSDVVFVFPGHGSGYPGMGRELYEDWPSFRADIDEGLALLRTLAGIDLRPVLFPAREARADAETALRHAKLGQPAVFLVSWALGRLLISWGIRPSALVGHSLGEYAAACLAGVMSLADGLKLVAARGALIASTPDGAMTAVGLSSEDLRPWLNPELSLAAINGPAQVVVAGTPRAVLDLEHALSVAGIEARRLPVPHAFHSFLMDPIVESLIAEAQSISLKKPALPLISCVSGQLLEGQATEAHYWGTHLRETVHFDVALRRACSASAPILVEVGPGDTLTKLVRRLLELAPRHALVTLGRESQQPLETKRLLEVVATMWQHDVTIELKRVHDGDQRRRVQLPAYPFERVRYWIDSPAETARDAARLPTNHSLDKDISRWLYRPIWQPSIFAGTKSGHHGHCLIFADSHGLAARMKSALPGPHTTLVFPGDAFEWIAPGTFSVRPAEPADYAALLQALANSQSIPDHVLHAWSLDADGNTAIERGFFSAIKLLRALGHAHDTRPITLQFITLDATVAGETSIERPEQAMLTALLRVIPEEYPNIQCQTVDVSSVDLEQPERLDRLARALLQETLHIKQTVAVAYRADKRFELGYERADTQSQSTKSTFRQRGTCLITGGLGGMGLVLARHLAQTAQARLVLVSRTGLPPRALWPDILAAEPQAAPDSMAHRLQCIVEFEQAGAEVLVLAADVANESEMQRVIAEIRKRFGAINGIIHAAAVIGGGVIQRHTYDDIQGILAPKVEGSRVLATLTANEPLDFFIMCSSLTAILGGFGQVAYAAANVFQDAFASTLRQRGIRAASINWDGWTEVGAAARAAKTAPNDAARKMAKEHTLLGRSVMRTSTLSLFQSRLDPLRDWILDEHRLHGKATLPGTAYLELARAAAAEMFGEHPIVIRDMVLFAPLIVENGEIAEIWTVVRKTPEGLAIEIHRRHAGTNGPQSVHAQCAVSLLTAGVPRVDDLHRLRSLCHRERSIDGLFAERRRIVDLGVQWQCIRTLWVGELDAVAEIEAPMASGYMLHPAVLDMGAGCAVHLAAPEQLPHAYGSIRIYGPLEGRIFAWVHQIEKNKRSTRFSVALYDDCGVARVEIDDYFLMNSSALSARENEQ